MSAKRFTLDNAECDCIFIDDNHINKSYTIINDKIKEKDLLEVVDLLNEQHETIRNLENELKGMKELLKSYRKTIEHDAELLADATKNGYLPPLENWKGDV